MKKSMAIFCLQIIFTTATYAQAQYQVTYDQKRNNQKVLTGIINKYLVMNDSSFLWYANNQKGYTVTNAKVLNAFEKNKNSVQFIVFGGTWCEDTQNILPKFFKLQELSGVADDKITFIGVNGNKKSLGNITDAMNITNVPTIIVMKNGKEVGRVIEYGKTGKWDEELAEILEKN